MFPENTMRLKTSIHSDKRPDLYKTEMCRNWTEMGYCRYGKKCRFAHGDQELRMVQRHVRYKTEICRTYHRTGTCLYGVRCTFIHDNDDDTTSSASSSVSMDDLPAVLLLDDTVIVTATTAAGSPSIYHQNNGSIGAGKRRLGAFSSICDQLDPWQSPSTITSTYEHAHLEPSW